MALLRTIWTPLTLCLGLIVLAFGVIVAGSPRWERAFVMAMIMLVLVVGLYIFMGLSGTMSFGHISFAAVGAYTTGLLTVPVQSKSQLLPHLPEALADVYVGSPIIAVIIGGVVAGIVAILLAIPLVRISGLSAGLATFALLVVTHTVTLNWTDITNGSAGVAGVPITLTHISAVVWAMLVIVGAFAYQKSTMGLRLRASREDEDAAQAVGINVRVQRGVAFIFSGFVVGLGGGLFAIFQGSFSPNTFYFSLTFLTITMLIVGGVASLTGAVLGTLSIAFLSELLRQLEAGISILEISIPGVPGLRDVGLALLLLLILLARPSGIVAGAELPFPTWFSRNYRLKDRDLERVPTDDPT